MWQRTLLVLAVSFFTFSSITANQPDTESMKRYDKDGLQLICFLVNGVMFFDDWEKPEHPAVDVASSVNRGDTIFPVIIFGTDAVDDSGNASLTYDFTLFTPDGEEYVANSDLVLWNNGPAGGMFYLMDQRVAVWINDSASVGV